MGHVVLHHNSLETKPHALGFVSVWAETLVNSGDGEHSLPQCNGRVLGERDEGPN